MKKYFVKARALKPEVSWFSSSNSQSLSPCFCGSFQPNSCALAQKKKHEEKGTRGVMCCDLLVLSGSDLERFLDGAAWKLGSMVSVGSNPTISL